MLRILAALGIVLAVFVLFAFRSSPWGLSLPVDAVTHRAYPINVVLFWILAVFSLGLMIASFRKP
jgi:hypothetical protein